MGRKNALIRFPRSSVATKRPLPSGTRTIPPTIPMPFAPCKSQLNFVAAATKLNSSKMSQRNFGPTLVGEA